MNQSQENIDPKGLDTATFGGGCFWCVEAIYQQLEGVVRVESGFAGGSPDNPSYEQVCTGTTGHAEVVQILFDPKKISFGNLLEVFFHVHDPTTLNRQGADMGTQYRSVIFYHNPAQKLAAETARRQADSSGEWSDPVVTEISPYTAFYKAEAYHQNYFNQNRRQPYCNAVISPKVDKFRKKYRDRLKKDAAGE